MESLERMTQRVIDQWSVMSCAPNQGCKVRSGYNAYPQAYAPGWLHPPPLAWNQVDFYSNSQGSMSGNQ